MRLSISDASWFIIGPILAYRAFIEIVLSRYVFSHNNNMMWEIFVSLYKCGGNFFLAKHPYCDDRIIYCFKSKLLDRMDKYKISHSSITMKV